MMKLLLDDYWMEFKNLVKARKRAEWLSDGWMLFYFTVFLPDMIFEGTLLAWNSHGWSEAFWFIVWVGIGLCRLYPNRLKEIFYLLPVSEKDRRNYLLSGYWLRISFFTVILACYLFVWIVVEKITFLRAGYLLLHYFLILCMVNTDMNDMARKAGDGMGRRFISCCVGFASMVLLYRASPGRAVWSANWLEAAVSVVEPFLAVAAGFSYWRVTIYRFNHDSMNCKP